MKTKKWRKNKHCCCQLVTAINARIYLGMENISDNSFEKLSELVSCKNGAAIGVQRTYKSLGLDFKTFKNGIPGFAWFVENLPIGVIYKDYKYGLHSALIIDVKKQDQLKTLEFVGADRQYMSWGEFCDRLPWHNHQLKFVSFKKASTL